MTPLDGKLRVWKCSFRTTNPTIFHVGIFVTEGDDGKDATGTMFHVVDNPSTTDLQAGLARLVFQELTQFSPLSHPDYHKLEQLGIMDAKKTDNLRALCTSTSDVVALNTELYPNCETWLDNILYDLHNGGIVNFKSGFPVPQGKKALVVSQ